MLAGDRAVDHEHRTAEPRGGEEAVHVELAGTRSRDRGQDDGQILGSAAGHDRVDRDLLDGAFDQVGRNHRDDFVGLPRGPGEHPRDPLRRRGHERKAVGPTSVVHRFGLVLVRAEFDAPRPKVADAFARCAGFGVSWFHGARSAPRSVRWQSRPRGRQLRSGPATGPGSSRRFGPTSRPPARCRSVGTVSSSKPKLISSSRSSSAPPVSLGNVGSSWETTVTGPS